MTKQVMTKAVKLARKMEGDWQARMKMALKMAWALVKKEVEKFVTTLGFGRKYWIAKINGTQPLNLILTVESYSF